MKRELIVAIDGPSGAGKSTLSKSLAKELGYHNIDTGAMYRSVALAAKRQSIDPADETALGRLAESVRIEFIRQGEGERVLLNGEDVSSAIRTPDISLLTSRISAYAGVRHAMVALQRQLGSQGGVVLEGRDIGTVVFPQADVKFFLSASTTERGRRRYEELRAKGLAVGLEQTVAEVEARDRADTARECAPLVQAEDALAIDSTALSIDEVLQSMLARVRLCRKQAGLTDSVVGNGR